MIKKIKENFYIYYIYQKLKQFKLKRLTNKKRYLQKIFLKRVGRKLDLENPILYNDKLQWLKLYWHDELAIKCADKYDAREYVENTIGKEFLNEIYGIYDNINQIDFESLPNQFVLKATNASGLNIICKNKHTLNVNQTLKQMRKWIIKNYSNHNFEWVYEKKSKIICEKFLIESDKTEILDYKFYCFNGEAKFLEIHFDRSGYHRRNFYDLNLNFLEYKMRYDNDPNLTIKKPSNFDEMIKIAQTLSKPFPHVRVDLYNVDGKIIFGELTFFTASGMGSIEPYEFEKQMGDWLILPNKKED